MTWRVYVVTKPNFVDHHGKSLEKEWRHAGLPAVKKIRVGQAYELSGGLSRVQADELARKLLADPITQDAVVAPEDADGLFKGAQTACVWPKPGVSDPVADTVAIGARDLGLSGLSSVRAGALYEFSGRASAKDIKSFCENFLMNPLVQQAEIH
jgi:phosphoribosylformylglycinamidine synthase subunit PurSL